ncbi:MAG: glycosyltransferase [Anaerolineae bacterium]|nr:glycosyltransferase [Anaerolineae bacterium]
MRILFLTPQMPYPPQKGTALRNWGLIKGLATKHDVAVLSFLDPGQTNVLAPHFLSVCRGEVISPPERTTRARLLDIARTSAPDMALRLASDSYADRLRYWLIHEEFDVVHIEGIEMAPYMDIVAAAIRRSLIIFDDHNCEYLLQRRSFETDIRQVQRWPAAAYSFIQWKRLRRYEAEVCSRADRVIAVSDADAAALHMILPNAEIAVVPNGIDSTAYRPQDSATQEESAIVFTGTMDFRPNIDAVLWFAQEVLPAIKQKVPNIHLYIVGQRPHNRLQCLMNNPSVTVTGWVEDPRPYIASAAVYVVPLRVGGGTRLKLLEAMAMGKAVVSTRLGAEGYPVVDGQELVLADSPEDFASAVVELLNDPQWRRALGEQGRAFVEQHYDWKSIIPQVEALYYT